MENTNITPFSNGTEGMMWYDSNCDRCVKAYCPKEGKDLPDFEATQKLVNLGRECKLKFALDLSHITGEITEDIAKQIGYKDGMPQQCLFFSDNEDDGWKPAPKKPIIPDPRQLNAFPLDTSNIPIEKKVEIKITA
jgi:hypothetical protein